jgi:hypothetical protein
MKGISTHLLMGMPDSTTGETLSRPQGSSRQTGMQNAEGMHAEFIGLLEQGLLYDYRCFSPCEVGRTV